MAAFLKNSDAAIFSRSGASKEDGMFFGFSDRAPRILNRQGTKLPNGFRRMSATMHQGVTEID